MAQNGSLYGRNGIAPWQLWDVMRSPWGHDGSLCGSPCSLSVSKQDPTAHFVAVPALSLCQCGNQMAHFVAVPALSLCQCGIPTAHFVAVPTHFLAISAPSRCQCGTPIAHFVAVPALSLCQCGIPMAHTVAVMAHFMAIAAHFVAVPALSLCQCRIQIAHFVAVPALCLCQYGIQRLTFWHSLLSVSMRDPNSSLCGSNGSLCSSPCSLSMRDPNGSLCGSPCSLSVSMWDPTAHFVALTAPSLCQCRILMAHFVAVPALSLCQCRIPQLTLWQSLLSVCVNMGSHGSLCGTHCSLSVSMQDPNDSLCGSTCSLSGNLCSLSVSMRDPTAHFVAVLAHFLAISTPSLCQCGIPRLTLWQSLLPLCVNAGSK